MTDFRNAYENLMVKDDILNRASLGNMAFFGTPIITSENVGYRAVYRSQVPDAIIVSALLVWVCQPAQRQKSSAPFHGWARVCARYFGGKRMNAWVWLAVVRRRACGSFGKGFAKGISPAETRIAMGVSSVNEERANAGLDFYDQIMGREKLVTLVPDENFTPPAKAPVSYIADVTKPKGKP